MSQRARILGLDQTLTEAAIKWVSADTTLLAGDHVVFADSSGGAVNVTLPPMAEAVGKFYFIQAPAGATADVSVLDYETGTEITTYGDMNADDDHALFYCTGIAWVVPFDGVA